MGISRSEPEQGNEAISWEQYLPPCHLDVSEFPRYSAILNHLCFRSSTGSHSLHFLLETVWLHGFQEAFLQVSHDCTIAPFSINTGLRRNWHQKPSWVHYSGASSCPVGMGGWDNEQHLETKGSVHFDGEFPPSHVMEEWTSPWCLWRLLEQDASPQLLSFGRGQKRLCYIQKAATFSFGSTRRDDWSRADFSHILVTGIRLGISGYPMRRELRTWWPSLDLMTLPARGTWQRYVNCIPNHKMRHLG